MATISSLGIGSGLDSEGIVSKLTALERQPLKLLASQAAFEKNKISAFGQVQSQFSALADVASRLSSSSAWVARKASTSNSAAATITATSTATTTAFTFDVDALAKSQSVTSGAVTNGALVGAGTLTFRLGKWSDGPASFAPASGSADVAITVLATDTVSTLAAKINAGNTGVVASVFRDGTTERLQLVSKDTGDVSGFRIQANDADTVNTDDAGLSRFGYDPEAAAFGFATSGVAVQNATDAKARINGLAVTSKTNTFADNYTGVSVTALAVTTKDYGLPGEVRASVNLSVSEDVTGAVRNVQDFVTAYNALASNLADLTRYDAATKTGNLFQGDSTVVGLQNLLRGIAGSGSVGSVYSRLNDVGIERQVDGTLSVNIVKLGAAANNGSELQKLFVTDNKSLQTNGFGLKFAKFASGALAAGGVVAGKVAALNTELTRNTEEQARVNTKADAVEARLRKQYSALDTKIASLSALNAYVTQQVTLWNKQGSN